MSKEHTAVLNKKSQSLMHKILHGLETVIALVTLAVIIGMLGLEIYRMVTVDGYFNSVDTYLNNILTIVVGLEFARMLIDLTPGNTLEVLIVAISRQVILTHNDPVSNLVCVACIAGLFATRRFLIRREDLHVELSKAE